MEALGIGLGGGLAVIYGFFASLFLAIGQFNFLNAATTGHVWWTPWLSW